MNEIKPFNRSDYNMPVEELYALLDDYLAEIKAGKQLTTDEYLDMAYLSQAIELNKKNVQLENKLKTLK